MAAKSKALSLRNVPGVTNDVAAIRAQIRVALEAVGPNGKIVGNSKWGVFCFYDYDGEPIYVGQTNESLRVRIRRHLTNHRTDAVAMNVLDPFEVKEIEMWPLWDLADRDDSLELLNAAEYAVYKKVLDESMFRAVLNEKDVAVSRRPFKLPRSHRACIIPGHLIEERSHPDTRIARRATTLAALAKVICERKVSLGLRRTLQVQSKRLEWLASERYKQFSAAKINPADEEE
jgi:hypothetical protein